jgi:hypothetical protein
VTHDDKDRRVVRARRPPESAARFASGSGEFGRTLPEGVATALEAIKHAHAHAPAKERDASATIAWGDGAITVEHRYGVVTIGLADGTRVTGTPEQAEELAKLLLARSAARR